MVKLFVSSHNMRQFHNNFGWKVNKLQSDLPFNFRYDFKQKMPFRNVFIKSIKTFFGQNTYLPLVCNEDYQQVFSKAGRFG